MTGFWPSVVRVAAGKPRELLGNTEARADGTAFFDQTGGVVWQCHDPAALYKFELGVRCVINGKWGQHPDSGGCVGHPSDSR